MSTKNLARTVIEGGRRRYSRFSRRHENAVERTRTHQVEGLLCRQGDAEEAYFPPRERVYREFDDKLGPALRWLRSQAGRPWDKVRSELFARFDIRTTAGRHIVFDHLLEEVRPRAPWRSHYRKFSISPHGILLFRQHDRKQWAAAWRRAPLPEPEHVLRQWLGRRRVIQHGERLYWLELTPHGAFRQTSELTRAETQRFRVLPAWFREGFEGPITLPGGSF
jgi:hypothetical protein